MNEVIFLFVIGLIWIVFASVQDLKKREVANWLSFSLMIFALGFRFFYSLFSGNGFGFFYQGLIGLCIFFILGNLLYYGRMFAGGDAKLMIALGTILPFSKNFLINLEVFILFLLLFLFMGALYGLIWSFILMYKNFKSFKKEFNKKIKENKKFIYLSLILGTIFLIISLILEMYFTIIYSLFIFAFPYLYFYARAVDDCCMIKKIKTKDLTEGDWLYKDVRIGKKLIKANWEGLSKSEINLIKKNIKSILIRQGIPFVPVFLISFILLCFLYYFNYLGCLWWIF